MFYFPQQQEEFWCLNLKLSFADTNVKQLPLLQASILAGPEEGCLHAHPGF